MKSSLRPTPLRGLVAFSLTAEERAGMELGDRIVEDYYYAANGEARLSNERIATDPSDEGKNFLDGTWDREYWEVNPPGVYGLQVRRAR